MFMKYTSLSFDGQFADMNILSLVFLFFNQRHFSKHLFVMQIFFLVSFLLKKITCLSFQPAMYDVNEDYPNFFESTPPEVKIDAQEAKKFSNC